MKICSFQLPCRAKCQDEWTGDGLAKQNSRFRGHSKLGRFKLIATQEGEDKRLLQSQSRVTHGHGPCHAAFYLIMMGCPCRAYARDGGRLTLLCAFSSFFPTFSCKAFKPAALRQLKCALHTSQDWLYNWVQHVPSRNTANSTCRAARQQSTAKCGQNSYTDLHTYQTKAMMATFFLHAGNR